MHGWNLALYLSHLLYGICVNIFLMNWYISKSYTRSKNTIYRVGRAVVSTVTSYDCFYCCFRDRVVPRCLGILCIAWAKFSGSGNRIDLYPLGSAILLVSLILIHWIEIYPMDSTIQLLKNGGLVYLVFIQL